MKVALYIYTKKRVDNSINLIVDGFKQNVIADGGTFEADACLKKQIESLGGVYGVGLNTVNNFAKRVQTDSGTFEGQNCLLQTINSLGGVIPEPIEIDVASRIELFEDEKISVTSSIQNINDISKVFTDYSQSFTVPASDTNNEIFKHWYENSLDNGFDQRIRYDGYIEIDTRTFRVGKWQIESASIKENRVEDYKITFYGNLKSLSDKFAEDKLKDVSTLNNYSFNYTGANVLSKVTSTTAQDVMFPFISSNRVWNVGGGATTDNINTNGHALNFRELYPAVNLPTIFNAIQSHYGLNFNGTFLSDKRFTDAYIWFKNNEQPTLNILGAPAKINITTLNGSSDFLEINTTNDTIKVIDFIPFNYGEIVFDITFNISTVASLVVSRNGSAIFSTSTTNLTPQTTWNFNWSIGNYNLNDIYEFYLQTSDATTYTGTLSQRWINDNTNEEVLSLLANVAGSTTNILNLNALAPDIKVTDFVTGILKTFNLTAFSEDGVNFTIEQLENWYYLGGIKDFSEYTTTDLEFNRIKPYKKIDFKYQKSENILNKFFFDTNQREYGDLSYTFNSDGSDYTIQLPFENMAFNRFTDTQFQVAYALKPDLTKYIPKPVLIYRYGLLPAAYHFDNGVNKVVQTNYNAFGQDVIYSAQRYSNNFGIEISSLDFLLVNNSLFNTYYLAYLNNLYSLKSRMLKVKMRLPYNELLDLKLNDRIVIRDKRYIINQYTTDLTTFESDFELIQDFRTVTFDNNTFRVLDNTAQTLRIDTISNEPLTWVEETSSGFIQSISNFDTYVDIEIKANPFGLKRSTAIVNNLNEKIIIIQNA
jgi:hypothetical protein